jgi:hypothetical protein
MALSKTVIDSLDDAKAALRNALAYAARNERPMICESIAKILFTVESIESSECLMDTLDNLKSKNGDGENPFDKFDF